MKAASCVEPTVIEQSDRGRLTPFSKFIEDSGNTRWVVRLNGQTDLAVSVGEMNLGNTAYLVQCLADAFAGRWLLLALLGNGLRLSQHDVLYQVIARAYRSSTAGPLIVRTNREVFWDLRGGIAWAALCLILIVGVYRSWRSGRRLRIGENLEAGAASRCRPAWLKVSSITF
ncbi:MAG: hypothetical protein NTZ05_14905 [Chloroflexi bacterium]|nr:hypothetical protein [Chloroflexota bacterium]